MGIGNVGRALGNNSNNLTVKDEVQSISNLRSQQEVSEGEIKVTSIDANQLANSQVIHIPAAQAAQQTVQAPITITGRYSIKKAVY